MKYLKILVPSISRLSIPTFLPQVTDDDGDSHVPSITFVDDSTIAEIVAVGEVPDHARG